jgi:hypothetical protein
MSVFMKTEIPLISNFIKYIQWFTNWYVLTGTSSEHTVLHAKLNKNKINKKKERTDQWRWQQNAHTMCLV